MWLQWSDEETKTTRPTKCILWNLLRVREGWQQEGGGQQRASCGPFRTLLRVRMGEEATACIPWTLQDSAYS